jgi:hypothetical protein
VVALDAVHRGAAAQLALVLARDGAAPLASADPSGAVAPAQAQAELSAPVALELAIFHMADELDLSPRRIRGPLVRLLERLRGAQFTLDTAKHRMEEWMASAP